MSAILDRRPDPAQAAWSVERSPVGLRRGSATPGRGSAEASRAARASVRRVAPPLYLWRRWFPRWIQPALTRSTTPPLRLERPSRTRALVSLPRSEDLWGVAPRAPVQGF